FGKFSYNVDSKTGISLPVFTAPTPKNFDTVWDGNAKIPGKFSDGTSNTIVFAEKYARCSGTNGTGGLPSPMGNWWMRGVFHGQKGSPNANDSDDSFPGDRLSSVFAGGIGDDGMKWASGLNSKFQVQPPNFLATPGPCDGTLATTSHAAMNAAFRDASIRSID